MSAYRGGYISIGKLAGVMGLHPIEMQEWLKERDLMPYNHYRKEDALHA